MKPQRRAPVPAPRRRAHRLLAAAVLGASLALAAPAPWDAGGASGQTLPEPPGGEVTGHEGLRDGVLPLRERISAPPGYRRLPAAAGSFAAWLRQLPVKPGRPQVRLFDGRPKANQEAHYAVLDLDVGSRDLQQCADAVIRLRAEYLFAGDCRDEIAFRFTSGDLARWRDWREGLRPRVSGARVEWRRSASADGSREGFRRYLDAVFTYAGTASLEGELLPVDEPSRPEIGDVFIQGGHPGHAVIVVDVAQGPGGERAMLLAQSYMPAQEIHVLKSPDDLDPWYRARSQGPLRTPEWHFRYEDLRRFGLSSCEALPPRR